MVLSGLNQTFDRFASVGPDNRIKIWDVGTGKLVSQLSPPSQLSAVISAFSWSSPRSQHLAVGTNQGSVIVWDVLKGEIVLQQAGKEGKAGAISDLAFHPLSKSIFVARATETHIVELDIDSGKEISKWNVASQRESTGVQKIHINHAGTVLFTASKGNNVIKAWELSSKKKIGKFAGHTNLIDSIATTSDSSFFSSKSQNDRMINIWKFAADGHHSSSSSSSAAVAMADEEDSMADGGDQLRDGSISPLLFTFACKLQLKKVSLNPFVRESNQKKKRKRSRSSSSMGSGGTDESTATTKSPLTFHVIGVTKHSVQMWEFRSDIQQNPPANQKPIGRIDTVYSQTSELLYADFCDADSLLVVHGSILRPTFEKIKFLNADGSVVEKVVLSAPESVASVAKKEENIVKDIKKTSVAVPQVSETHKLSSAKVNVDTVSDEGKKSKKQASLQESLSALKQTKKRAVPQINSLLSTLQQAIKTSDEEMLNSCLSTSDKTVIQNTIKRLPTEFVMPFLQCIVKKFQQNPNRSAHLVLWIKSLLEIHSSFLMTMPNLQHEGALASLYQTIEARMASFQKLVLLSGRLDLVLSQISAREKHAGARSKGQDSRFEFLSEADLYSDDEDEDDDEDAEEDDDEDEDREDDDDDDEEDDEEDLEDDEDDEDEMDHNHDNDDDGDENDDDEDDE